MFREYFGQRMAAAVLVLAGFVLLSGYENDLADNVRSHSRWMADTAAKMEKDNDSASASLTGRLIAKGDVIADAGGADKASKGDIRAWYAARYELEAAKWTRDRLKGIRRAADVSRAKVEKLSRYMTHKLTALLVLLLGALAAFFIYNFERKYKLLLLGNAGLAALLYGFFIAVLLWVFDWWPKGWFSCGSALIGLLAGAGLLAILLYQARKTFSLGAAAPGPGLVISAGFLKITWLAGPVFYAPYFLVLCVMIEEIFNTGVITNNPDPVMSVLFGYSIAAFLALPLRIKGAAGKFGKQGGL